MKYNYQNVAWETGALPVVLAFRKKRQEDGVGGQPGLHHESLSGGGGGGRMGGAGGGKRHLCKSAEVNSIERHIFGPC